MCFELIILVIKNFKFFGQFNFFIIYSFLFLFQSKSKTLLPFLEFIDEIILLKNHLLSFGFGESQFLRNGLKLFFQGAILILILLEKVIVFNLDVLILFLGDPQLSFSLFERLFQDIFLGVGVLQLKTLMLILRL